MQNATRALRGTLPPEIIDLIRPHLVGDTIRPALLRADQERVTALIDTVKAQLKDMSLAIEEHNPYIWRAVLTEPLGEVENTPEQYDYRTGMGEEVCLVMSYIYPSWAETPGAVDIIRALRKSRGARRGGMRAAVG